MNEKSLEENYKSPTQKKFSLSKKELMYGFIVIFLLLIMYFLGQISTQMIYQQVKEICPSIVVTSVSPFGISYVSRGQYQEPNDTPFYVP